MALRAPLLVLASAAVAVVVVVGDPHYYHSGEHPYHGRKADFYGEYLVDGHGYRVYIHCFDPRFTVRYQCRDVGRDDYDHRHHHHSHSHHHHRYPDYRFYTHHHRHTHYDYDYRPGHYNQYDGRQNTNVGHGKHFYRGNTLYVECEFPRANWLISNIVWHKRSSSGDRKFDGYFATSPKDTRIKVETFGRNGSRLVIKNYSFYRDSGVYRCFATRYSRGSNYDRSGGRPTESVYMEVEVGDHWTKKK